MKRPSLLIVPIGLILLSACGTPDTKALHTLACQQAANTVDLQSVAQLDLLRKALGLAPGVDPVGTCKALGVDMNPKTATPEDARESEPQSERDN
ncbi:MAG: hypothetical protein FJ077_06450 [Cyanobacteria bacterium K_DeepCast_35m_m2_023]|nr:hypothetical protein [Cyanobacteria bacterium K_DeepCast_35m_m2_023]